MPLPPIEPPLINSANPWATTAEDLQSLFDCEFTGAVTIRTSLLDGFEHDDTIHQYVFFEPSDHSITHKDAGTKSTSHSGSLNTLGYSPINLGTYLTMIRKIVTDSSLPETVRRKKPFIISVTGSAEAVRTCHERIATVQKAMDHPLCMEINLSCPNIPDKPPPAYSGSSLTEHLDILNDESSVERRKTVPIGIKTPPYTYHDQFNTLITSIASSCKPYCPIDFITAVNTLGSSLVLSSETGLPAINSASGAGIGGMAGAPLHPLALGNVKILREILDSHRLKDVDVIGVGGVGDRAGYERMKLVGAKVVGVGTALGKEGVGVFQSILKETPQTG